MIQEISGGLELDPLNKELNKLKTIRDIQRQTYVTEMKMR